MTKTKYRLQPIILGGVVHNYLQFERGGYTGLKYIWWGPEFTTEGVWHCIPKSHFGMGIDWLPTGIAPSMKHDFLTDKDVDPQTFITQWPVVEDYLADLAKKYYELTRPILL